MQAFIQKQDFGTITFSKFYSSVIHIYAYKLENMLYSHEENDQDNQKQPETSSEITRNCPKKSDKLRLLLFSDNFS